MSRPNIVITCGDVNGIGLRCLAGAMQLPINADLHLVISPSVLRSCISAYGLPDTFDGSTWRLGGGAITISPLTAEFTVTPGMAGDDASRLAIASLEYAFEHVRSGQFEAVMTLPINKHALDRVGWAYPGQTEMVAAYTGGQPLMVLCTSLLHVALATVHLPLKVVAQSLSVEGVAGRLRQLHQHLRDRIGLADPRIAVLGLNPHAGEQGRIGLEEDRVIRPAIKVAQAEGIAALGPFPADGFFGFGAYEDFDGVLAMYHDQGLIPLKLLAKGAGVNVTAGLSIIRTSPDHGTAYDRIHSADIDSASTRLALEMAIRMSESDLT